MPKKPRKKEEPKVIMIDPNEVKGVIPITGPKPVIEFRPKDETRTAVARCGHVVGQHYDIWFNGLRIAETSNPTFPDARIGGTSEGLCAECEDRERPYFGPMVACTFCGHPIASGSGVGLFIPSTLTAEQEARAQRDPQGHYLSCTSMDCLPSGGFYAGTWNGAGGINSPFERGTMAAEAFSSGREEILVIDNVK